MMNKKTMGMITITTAAMLAASAGADPLYWIGNSNAQWTNGANWYNATTMSFGAAPTAADDVTITSSGLYDPQVNASTTINSLSVAVGARLSYAGANTLTIDHGDVSILGELDLNQSGATLDVQTGDVSVSGEFKLSHADAEVYAQGETAVASAGMLAITGEYYAQGAMEVEGQVEVPGLLETNSTLDIVSGATLEMSGTHTASAAMTVNGAVQVDGAFTASHNVDLYGEFVIGATGSVQANQGAQVRIFADQAIELQASASMTINNAATLQFNVTPGMTTPSFELNGSIELDRSSSLLAAPKIEVLQDARLFGTGSLIGRADSDAQVEIDSSAEFVSEVAVKGEMSIQSQNNFGQRGVFANKSIVEADRDGAITFGDELSVTDTPTSVFKVSHADGVILFDRAQQNLDSEFQISAGAFDFQQSIRTTGPLVCSGSPNFILPSGGSVEFRWLYNEPGEDFINASTSGCP